MLMLIGLDHGKIDLHMIHCLQIPALVMLLLTLAVPLFGLPICNLLLISVLSSTEAEYIAVSSSLCEFIGVLNLMNELKECKFSFNHSIPNIKCRVFEDNMICIAIATNHRTRPRTKHILVRLHQF